MFHHQPIVLCNIYIGRPHRKHAVAVCCLHTVYGHDTDLRHSQYFNKVSSKLSRNFRDFFFWGGGVSPGGIVDFILASSATAQSKEVY